MIRPKFNLTKVLEKKQIPIRAIYISSYIPRKCGIATFTKDLTSVINLLNPEALAEIVALTDPDSEYDYPWEVKFRIEQENANDYSEAAKYINQSSADVVCLQHEFGLFGGVSGDYILPMLDSIEKPIVSCFHTILPNPSDHQKYVMSRIVGKSDAVIAMSKESKKLLVDIYGADEDQAVVIYHGVPDVNFEESNKYKKELNIEAERMILMSGLLSAGKGMEYSIEAMPEILKHFPSTKLYIVGETHPSVLRNEKENYRDKLINLSKKYEIEQNVIFINEFLELEDLMKYYKAADIYITPHLDPQQPTSGTLSKALGVGNVCISTPYLYASEMLAEDVGILVPFKESQPISDAVIKVLGNPTLFEQYRESAFKIGKLMQWPRVAARYLELVKTIINSENGNF